ncbi:MAG: hypothetical protein RMJ56_01910 [Gemmataceae bacterium]|nr:hypothetical protein [Gemmata sp.]MDW8196339.1 hypothetical protein [Gemmataceae bacterium]
MMPIVADGMAAGLENRVVMLVFKCLAVGGGFLVGYLLGYGLAWALNRWVFAYKAPGQLKSACAILAGVGLAIVVALFVFGEGGRGLFGGGGPAEGTGVTAPDDRSPTPPPRPEKKDDPPPPQEEPLTPPQPADVLVHVTILGGSDVPNDDEKFYLIDDDPSRKTFSELKDAILKRQAQKKGTVGIVIHFRPKNAPSLDPPHYSISQLTRWAKETAKVDVTFAANR